MSRLGTYTAEPWGRPYSGMDIQARLSLILSA